MNTQLTVDSVSREVSTHSGPLTILDDINLTAKHGESVAIQGASGSGKSTLLGVLAGLDLPQAGTVIIDGTDITKLDEDQRAILRAGQVGFVFQSFYLIDDLTALENVALPLELFGAKEPQRVALCRAFAVQPRLLFADEPTANLDTTTSNTVLDQLFSLQRELNTTMLIATHDDSLAQRCDRRLYLQSGRLVEA